ncbi:MAG: UDP-3-O-(3-hydroxymyristoyl)glucosamine N-acyltransferase [Halanaerobiaceae bacterium]
MDVERENAGKKYYTVKQLARMVKGRVEGESACRITRAGSIKNSDENTVTFAENQKYLKKAKKSGAGAVIVPENLEIKDKTIIKVKNPRLAYAKIAGLFAPQPWYDPGIHHTAVIADSAEIGNEVSIHPGVVVRENAVIGNKTVLGPGVIIGKEVEIGDNTLIHPQVVIEQDTTIGSRVIIQAGSVIGSDGYGYVSDETGHHKIPQLGRVVIEDEVEIGASVTIDRAASGTTVIKEGSKIDNLVQIAHNVKVGKDNLIIAQTGIAGSSELGDRVILAGQAGVVDHVKLGDETKVATNSIVTKNTSGNMFYSGNPAQNHKKELKEKAALRKLPKLLEKIRQLEKRVNELEEKG